MAYKNPECDKAWREANKENIKGRMRVWRDEHKEEIKAYEKAYREANNIRVCSVCGAEKQKAKKYCRSCRDAQRKTGVDTCTKCQQTKPVDRFSSVRLENRTCKDCQKQYCLDNKERLIEFRKNLPVEKVAEYNRRKEERRRTADGKIKAGLWRLKSVYDLAPDAFIELFDWQGRACAICAKPLVWPCKSTHVDHCHKTGKVRGILFSHCNSGCGLFKEDVRLLEKATRYVQDGGVSIKKAG